MKLPIRVAASLAFAVALGGFNTSALAQGAPAAAATDSTASVRAFVDCQGPGCDNQFFIDQMKWVNFVRDRLFADVTLLVSSLRTGSGGTEHTITAIGGQANAGRADTVKVFSAPNDAQDVMRRRLMRTFSLLLGPYAARTAAAERMNLTYTAPAGAISSAPARDPWNFWIYRVSANGFANGEKSQNFHNAFFNASANRVTANWKLNLGSNLSYDQSKFEFADGTSFKKIQRDYGINGLAVKSINDHWSAGATFRANYSDFLNYDLNLQVQPALEWNYYAYRDFTRKQLTAFYSLGMLSTRYQDTTIYGKLSEAHP
jgi:hypothetical protein